MQNFEEKPKRKRGPRNPYLFLGAGIAIGIVIAAAVMVLLLFGIESSETQMSTEANDPTIDIATTTTIFDAQDVQPTPIASRIQAAAISPTGETLAYIKNDGGISSIFINELRAGNNLSGNRFVLYEARGTYTDVVFNPDGSKLIATTDNGTAALFDVLSRTLIEEYINIGAATFTESGQRLVLVGRNSGIRVLDVSTAQPNLVASRIIEDRAYIAGAADVNRNNDLAVAFGERVEIYNLRDLQSAPQIINPNHGFVQDLVFHPTQSNVLALGMSGQGVSNGVVQIYDLNNTSRTQYDFNTSVFAIAFSSEGDWLAVAGGLSGIARSEMIAFQWDTSGALRPDVATFFQPLVFEGHDHTIFDVSFTPEGYLLSAAFDGSIRLWELVSDSDPISTYYP